MEIALYEKIMNEKKISLLAQSVDEMVNKLKNMGRAREILQFRRDINKLIDDLEEKLLL